MANFLYLNPDILLHYARGVWLASNPRLRCHVELDASAILALAQGAKGQELASWGEALASASGRDRTERAMGSRGLHVDHSGVAKVQGMEVQGTELLGLLHRRRVLIASRGEADELLRTLTSVLDGESLGSFHQRVGQHLLLQRQREHWRAWQNQKFTTDGRQLQPGPYKDIQAPFFDSYFSPERIQGKHVLDFGCGNGYFSARMAETGAEVLALDNSSELLALAQANHGNVGGLRFVKTSTFDEVVHLLDELSPKSFDYVYLQDTLLLLLRPESGEASPQLQVLFQAFHRILKPSGRLCAMEPNATFWLAGRYGDSSRPYAVVTECYHPLFNVVPRLEEVVAFMADAGFALCDYRHPRPVGADMSYAEEFPIWDFFSFAPL